MDIRNLFSHISGTYDLLNRVLSLGQDQVWRRKAVALLPQERGTKILDLASGTLDMSLQYRRKGKGEVFATDFSFGMLTQGKRKLAPPKDQQIHLVLNIDNAFGIEFALNGI